MYALIDCNNFYASCERLFRPDLRNKPIVVLSNNDGCVIARSNEAKALKIAMGAPFFKIKALCLYHKVEVFASNYVLYGDLSDRVMSVIEEAWDEVEQYSIDEAFLDLSAMPIDLHDNFCHALQKKILQSTGIPTWDTYRINYEHKLALMTLGARDGDTLITVNDGESHVSNEMFEKNPITVVANFKEFISQVKSIIDTTSEHVLRLHSDAWGVTQPVLHWLRMHIARRNTSKR